MEITCSNKKAVILLSSGLDSVVSLAMAEQQGYTIELALTVDYGQKAAERELQRAKNICKHYKIEHKTLDIRSMMQGINSGLAQDGKIPSIDEDQLDNLVVAKETAKQVWVPNRNGLLINIAAMYAENLDCRWVITGFNKEEAATFPDNTSEFVDAVNHALSYSTSNQVQVISLTQAFDKKQIVSKAIELQVPIALIWSCYYGDQDMCGECESCKRFKRALEPYVDTYRSISFRK